MALKLCQEGNWEPLIERIVLRKWIVGIEMPVHADAPECVTTSQGCFTYT